MRCGDVPASLQQRASGARTSSAETSELPPERIVLHAERLALFPREQTVAAVPGFNTREFSAREVTAAAVPGFSAHEPAAAVVPGFEVDVPADGILHSPTDSGRVSRQRATAAVLPSALPLSRAEVTPCVWPRALYRHRHRESYCVRKGG